jgi:hypothetical protein
VCRTNGCCQVQQISHRAGHQVLTAATGYRHTYCCSALAKHAHSQVLAHERSVCTCALALLQPEAVSSTFCLHMCVSTSRPRHNIVASLQYPSKSVKRCDNAVSHSAIPLVTDSSSTDLYSYVFTSSILHCC